MIIASGTAGTAPIQEPSLPKISDEIGLWLTKERGLSLETLAMLPVASGTTFFPDLKQRSAGVFFGYNEGWKARAIPEKAFVASKGWKPSFWNLKSVLEALNQGSFGFDVYLTEGEIDAASLVETGIPPHQVLSVPTGASGTKSDDRGIPYVIEALQAGLNKAKKIIWCGDADEVGLALRAQMMRQFGAAKFWFVDWPDNIKDANDLLKVSGPEALRDHILTQAKPWPTTGIYRLSELPEPPKLTLWEPDIECLKGKVWLAPSTVSLVVGQPGHGKALAVDTPIPTPDGWTLMGDLRPGDIVYDETGQSCRVMLTTPIMLNHECFRVRFDDGSEIIADADHQWLTESVAARRSEGAQKRRDSRSAIRFGIDQREKRILPTVVTTSQIAETLVVNGKKNHAIRLSDPVQFNEQDLPIPPYTLGVWLGDGHSYGAVITKDDRDAEILSYVAAEGIPVRRRDNGDWSLSDGVYSQVKDCVLGRLKRLGVYGNKHIPSIYKRASIAQRLALVQGLMDTDGHVSNGAAEFCTTKAALAEGFYELVCSLGIRAKIDIGRALLYGKDCGPKFRVRLASTLPIFKLLRKAQINSQFTGRRKYRYVVSCEKVPSVPVRCIQVDSPSKLYLAGRSFIPTHNSVFFGQVFYEIISKYNLVGCFASFETRPKPYMRRQIRTLFHKSPEYQLTQDELAQADKWIDEHYLFVTHPEQRPTLGWFLDMAEIAVVRHGAQILQIDPWNRLEASRAKDETETEYIGKCLTALAVFAVDMNVHIQIICHPSKMDNVRRGRAPELEDAASSKHWENRVDQGFVIHRPRLFDEVGNRVTKAMFIVRKSRFEELGYPMAVRIDYDLVSKTFVPDYTTDMTSEA